MPPPPRKPDPPQSRGRKHHRREYQACVDGTAAVAQHPLPEVRRVSAEAEPPGFRSVCSWGKYKTGQVLRQARASSAGHIQIHPRHILTITIKRFALASAFMGVCSRFQNSDGVVRQNSAGLGTYWHIQARFLGYGSKFNILVIRHLCCYLASGTPFALERKSVLTRRFYFCTAYGKGTRN